MPPACTAFPRSANPLGHDEDGGGGDTAFRINRFVVFILVPADVLALHVRSALPGVTQARQWNLALLLYSSGR